MLVRVPSYRKVTSKVAELLSLEVTASDIKADTVIVPEETLVAPKLVVAKNSDTSGRASELEIVTVIFWVSEYAPSSSRAATGIV